jgi:hypothetical protein
LAASRQRPDQIVNIELTKDIYALSMQKNLARMELIIDILERRTVTA